MVLAIPKTPEDFARDLVEDDACVSLESATEQLPFFRESHQYVLAFPNFRHVDSFARKHASKLANGGPITADNFTEAVKFVRGKRAEQLGKTYEDLTEFDLLLPNQPRTYQEFAAYVEPLRTYVATSQEDFWSAYEAIPHQYAIVLLYPTNVEYVIDQDAFRAKVAASDLTFRVLSLTARKFEKLTNRLQSISREAGYASYNLADWKIGAPVTKTSETRVRLVGPAVWRADQRTMEKIALMASGLGRTARAGIAHYRDAAQVKAAIDKATKQALQGDDF